MNRRRYDKEFKQTIVDLLSMSNPKSIDEICLEYQLKKPTVYGWLSDYKSETGAFKDEETLALEQENKRLRKQLKNMKEERDILKKAVSIFSVSE